MDGLTPNQKALFLAQEQKAAEANRVLDENRNLRVQLEAAQQARYGAVQANPLAAEWTCTQGLRHRLTTAMLPDDTAATQAERHALRLAAVLSIFPEAESPR